jgi:hypothetical protein
MDAGGSSEQWAEAFPWLTRSRLVARLQDVLQAAELAQRSSATALRSMGRADLAARADGYAARVRADLDDPLAAQWLHAREGELRAAASLDDLLDGALRGALWLMSATRGNVQLADPGTGALHIAAQRGFGREFLDYFAAVTDTTSVCGRAAGQHTQVVVTDVDTDSAFAPHRDIATAAGFRAVQSTPLIDASGRLRGVLSTHYPVAHCPPEQRLRLMTRYGMIIADALASTA